MLVSGVTFATPPLAVEKAGNKPSQTAPVRFVTDATITDKVKTELLADKNIVSLSISVATDKGIVTLSGKVENQLQKDEVVKVTSQISGVKSVIDQLTVSQI